MKLSELPNIGKELEKKLNSVGIQTPDELAEVGSVAAVKRISSTSDDGCLNMLYALEGAIQGIRWHYLPAEIKKKVKDELLNEKVV
jgi:DNA transformation protein